MSFVFIFSVIAENGTDNLLGWNRPGQPQVLGSHELSLWTDSLYKKCVTSDVVKYFLKVPVSLFF